MADYIINEKYKDKKDNVQDETERIIKAAANLIKAEIKEQNYDSDVYPTANDIKHLNWIPDNLRLFLKNLINSELKQESLGQCIIKATNWFSIPPLLFGLGVDLDQTFGSKWLVDQLARLGFSVSSDEVKLFKQSVLNLKVILIVPYSSISQGHLFNGLLIM